MYSTDPSVYCILMSMSYKVNPTDSLFVLALNIVFLNKQKISCYIFFLIYVILPKDTEAIKSYIYHMKNGS